MPPTDRLYDYYFYLKKKDKKEPGESRKGRNLEPKSLKTILDDVQLEDSNKQDEEIGESQQWSIISLFSRVLPQRV